MKSASELKMIGEYFYSRHVDGELLRGLFIECYELGKDSALVILQNQMLVKELQAAQAVIKEMENRK